MTGSNPKPRPRLLLDVTIAATTELNTGIQRVVRNICLNAENTAAELDLECVPVVCHGDQLTAVGFDGRARVDVRIARMLKGGWMGFHNLVAGWLSALRQDAGKRYLSVLSRLRKLLIPKTLVRAVANGYRRMTGQVVKMSENDVLVLLDASWDLPLESLLQNARQKQIPVVTVIYDLIPILHPEFHPESLRAVFTKWFELVLEHSNLMIGISKTVQDDLVPFGEQKQGPQSKGCILSSFRLGADFDAGSKAREATRASTVQLGTCLQQGFYLAVGTIEPRKNHAFLLDAFDRLWASGSNAQLVVVGKIGWMCEGIADRLRQHPELNHRLFFYDDADDQQLSELYQQAKALIFPSIVEGFGLPIVEAFQHRLPVMVSDTRIHREVAGEDAHYFGLNDPSELVSLVQQADSGELQLGSPELPGVTWQMSCREFLGVIDSFLNESSSASRSDLQREAA